jgi:hypothetical protein
LEKQLIVRIITHGTINTLHPTAPLVEFIDQEHLMDIMASQAIGSCEHHACKGRHGHSIAQTVEAGTLEGGAAITVIAVDVLGSDMPVGLRGDIIVETAQLLVNSLLLLLTAGRDTDVESDFHGEPPEHAMGQDRGLLRVP